MEEGKNYRARLKSSYDSYRCSSKGFRCSEVNHHIDNIIEFMCSNVKLSLQDSSLKYAYNTLAMHSELVHYYS